VPSASTDDGSVTASIFVAATIWGFEASLSLNSDSSRRIVSKSSIGSRPDSPDTSTR
jgi:hypothetical protein